jgi:hypothetical protein
MSEVPLIWTRVHFGDFPLNSGNTGTLNASPSRRAFLSFSRKKSGRRAGAAPRLAYYVFRESNFLGPYSVGETVLWAVKESNIYSFSL